ncbi:cation transporter [Butyrivibrio sp. VCB2006]|uniref:cation transporter n=1 Tax=Butyrivibrio sp. VCB2006 TaxID=1280679 RepID=UPI0004256809|nr:cation transporter [Butyrivibrio sp. VCB2006]
MAKDKMDSKGGYKTLLLSVILSSPGPLVLGIGLTVGRSSTQISDFTRRSAELLAIIASFVVFCITNKDSFDQKRKREIECKSNLFVGIIMCISGLSMIILAFLSDNESKGNVAPAFVIALFGAITNTLFWRKYTKLHNQNGNAILGVQARLYGAKSIVDVCVTLTLFVVAAMPCSKAAYYFDIVGSILVSLYMLRSGIKTIIENRNKLIQQGD